jgi:DNA polymerase III subunit beta
MKIECIKEKLSQAIGKAERVTGKNLTLPVLSCVLIEAYKGTLTIKATNLDLGVEITLPVKIEKEGMVAVPGGILNAFLQSIYNDKNITLELKEGNLHVSTTHTSTVIKSLPHDDFPSIPRIDDGKKVTIAARDFLRGLKSVWYSAAIGSFKPELSSVYIYPESENIIFVATDSFRLAEKRIVTKKLHDVPALLIPFKNIPEIMRTLEEFDSVELHLSKNQIAFSGVNTYLTSRIIDGSFPDYRQIIPKEHTTEVVVLKQDLINTLKIAHIFSDKFNKVTINVDPKAKKCEISTKNNDIGENNNTLDATIKGDPVTMSFNYKYLTDCFQSLEGDSVSLEFSNNTRPVVIKSIGDNSFTYIAMPMNK